MTNYTFRLTSVAVLLASTLKMNLDDSGAIEQRTYLSLFYLTVVTGLWTSFSVRFGLQRRPARRAGFIFESVISGNWGFNANFRANGGWRVVSKRFAMFVQRGTAVVGPG